MRTTLLLMSLCTLSMIVVAPATRASSDRTDNTSPMTSIPIRVGEKAFDARHYNNPTAAPFVAMLPLTLKMSDLNDNEKVIDLPEKLPGEVTNPGTIHAGDLMIWSGRSLVLFYKTFPTRYSYAKLGRIENATGLAEAVGARTVTVTFEKP